MNYGIQGNCGDYMTKNDAIAMQNKYKEELREFTGLMSNQIMLFKNELENHLKRGNQ
jgi:hypothetical protein